MNPEPGAREWDAFVSGVGGHYAQSSLWAHVKAGSGWHAARVAVRGGERIVGGAQLLIRSVGRLGSIGYVPKGPVIPAGDLDISESAIDAVLTTAEAHRVRHLTIQPPSNDETVSKALLGRGFDPNPALGSPAATLRIDLSRSPEQLLAAMKKSTRRNIRQAGRSNEIRVGAGTEVDLGTFFSLRAAASERKGFSIFPEKYYTHMWDVLRAGDNIQMFVADYRDETVSAMLVITWGDTAYTHVSGWSGRHGTHKPNEVLEWAAIRWARAAGYRFYDFEGIDPLVGHAVLRGQPLPAPLTPGRDASVTEYKLGFGGQVALLAPAYEYVSDPLLRWAYQRVYPNLARLPLAGMLRKGLSRVVQSRR